jgi:hypothetical protein
VLDVQFGALPPLLLNVKWSPPIRKRQAAGTEATPRKSTSASDATADSDDSDDDGDARCSTAPRAHPSSNPNHVNMEDIEKRSRDTPETDEECHFYAACTADMAFRSGIKFTIATQ